MDHYPACCIILFIPVGQSAALLPAQCGNCCRNPYGGSDYPTSCSQSNYQLQQTPDLPAAQHQPNTLEQGWIKLTALLCGTNYTSMLSVAPAQNFAPQHNGGMMKGFCSSMPAILTGYKRMQHNRINESLYKKKNTINSKSCTLVYRKSNQVQ